MKKLISILMCVVLVFSLAACTGVKNNDADTTVPDASIIKQTTEKPETTEAKPVEKKISRGIVSENVYTSEFLSVTFEKPEEWIYATDEEMAQLVDLGQDIIELNSLEKMLSETATVYDMSASDDKGNSVMICYENTMLTALREITEDEFEQQLKVNLAKVEGYDYEYVSSEDVTLGEGEFKKIVFTVTVENITLSQAYYIKVIGKYAASVIITSTDGEIETMEAMFS